MCRCLGEVGRGLKPGYVAQRRVDSLLSEGRLPISGLLLLGFSLRFRRLLVSCQLDCYNKIRNGESARKGLLVQIVEYRLRQGGPRNKVPIYILWMVFGKFLIFYGTPSSSESGV